MMTGGTGFAGSHTVRRYIEAGHEVRLLVRDREKVRRIFDPQGIAIPEEDVIEGDIVDLATVERAMERCDAVYHGAALVDMRRKMASRVLETNARGVSNVIGHAVKRGLPRIVYVSSASIFFAPGSGPIHLDMEIQPVLLSMVLQQALTDGRTADVTEANNEDAHHGRCARQF